MLFAQEFLTEVKRAIGTLPTDSLGLVNEALRWLIDQSNEWQWAERSYTMDLVADYDTLPLPEDFLKLSSDRIALTGGLSGWVYPSTRAEIDRQGTRTPGQCPELYTVQWRSGDGQTQPFPELRVWPTPNVDTVDGLTFSYFSRFVPFQHDGSLVEMPEYMLTIAKETVRVFAKGRWMEDDMDLAGRIERLKSSSMFLDAVATDAMQQPNLGQGVPGIPHATSTNLAPKFDITYAPGQ